MIYEFRRWGDDKLEKYGSKRKNSGIEIVITEFSFAKFFYCKETFSNIKLSFFFFIMSNIDIKIKIKNHAFIMIMVQQVIRRNLHL